MSAPPLKVYSPKRDRKEFHMNQVV